MSANLSAKGPVPAPVLGDEEYAQAFAAFRARTNRRGLMLEWCERTFEKMHDRDKFEVLSVGTGNGDFDFELLPILHFAAKHITLTAVEPNPVMTYELGIGFEMRRLSYAELKVSNTTFEEFADAGRYDLIHFTHCLCFMSDREAVLTKALDSLAPGGFVLIFHSMLAGVQDLRARFAERASGTRQGIFSGEELEDALCAMGARYTFEQLDSAVDITACFEDDSEAGRRLLDFFLLCDTSEIDPQLKAEVLAYLKNISTERSGRRSIPHPIGVFRVFAGT